MQRAYSYFTSNTVVEFLPGLHELNYTGHIYIFLARNLTLIGSDSHMTSLTNYSHSDSVVFCTGYSGFFFQMVRDLKIVNLHFTHCGAVLFPEYSDFFFLDNLPESITRYLKVYIALAMWNVHNLVLSKVTVEKSYGFGLYGMNIFNRSLITDSYFINNNEYVSRHQRCIDLKYSASCTGGNARLTFMDSFLPGTPAINTFEINNSEFLRGVATIQPEPQLALAGGLEILVGVFYYDIHITINNTVIAENSGFIAGNMYVHVSFGVEHAKIRVDRCYIHSGKMEKPWLTSSQMSFATGLMCGVTLAKEDLNGDTTPVYISNTKFDSNVGGAATFVFGGKTSCACNSSAYHVVVDNCEFTTNLADIGHTGLMAGIMSDKFKPLVAVQETVLRVRLVIQNSAFHHNFKVRGRRQNLDLIRIFQMPEILIINCTFENNTGSRTVVLFRSKVIFQGNLVFQNNTSTTDGGALHLDDSSLLHFKPDTRISFINNTALQKGGAIYVETMSKVKFCFFELDDVWRYSQANVQLTFERNTAGIAGDALYGGEVDRCALLPSAFPEGPYRLNGSNFDEPNVRVLIVDLDAVFVLLFNFTDKTHSSSLISSDPYRICFCNNESEPDFALAQSIQKEAYPGQVFVVEAVAVGQYNGTTPSVVIARAVTNVSSDVLDDVQLAQETKRSCTQLQYTISSARDYEVILLAPAGGHLYLATINTTLLDCPPGFALQYASHSCACHPRLRQYNVTCSINDQTITKADTAWISFDESHGSGIILHPECPFDYCQVGTVTFRLTENPDSQCAFNHTGVLCGACLPGFSLALGTSRCLECSSSWILLLLPFAIAGLALVFVLLTLNLTVSTGTINGLIFYANIVRANHTVFFPPGDRSIFSLFIAWLNLDLGLETCFWDGLDGYTKTWLQFLFPVYIWVIVVVVILLSRRYILAAKLCGPHTVKALATLFLLSYAKVLRTIITALSFTTLTLPNGSIMTVWLYDGNVEYLGLKHTFLFFVALGFAIGFVVPFTLLVLLAPCLQAWSNRRHFRWVHRIKPLLDAYQGPYTDRFRCWTGVILVVRNVLFLSFAANGLGDPEVNLELITTTVFLIQAFMFLPGRVYKVFVLNILETVFIVKLGILSAWTIFVRHKNSESTKGQMIAAYIITAFTIMIFLVIVCYHIYITIKASQFIKGFLARRHQRQQEVVQQEDCSSDRSGSPTHTVPAPTVTYINMSDLRESLLS